MHHEHFDPRKIHLLNALSLCLGFFGGFLLFIQSNYFAQMSGNEHVGAFYFVSYVVILLALFNLQRLIRVIGKSRALYLVLGTLILTSALLTRMDVSWASIAVLTIFVVAANIVWVVLDILIESFSEDGVSGRIRGFNLMVMNAGYLFAPLLSTTILDRFGYSGIFFILLIGYIVVFLIALVGLRNDNHVSQERIRLLFTLRKIIRERDLLRVYNISFSLEFFYAIMIVYTPLYLLSLGFSWPELGIIFTIMLIPFVLLQYPLGLLADRRLGEKELLIASILIALLGTAVLAFVHSHSVLVWGLLLLLGRVGISGIEILRDAYFFKQIDGNDMDVIAFFRTTVPVANILAAVLAVLLLIFVPLQGMFLVVSLVLGGALVSAFFITDTPAEGEVAQGRS